MACKIGSLYDFGINDIEEKKTKKVNKWILSIGPDLLIIISNVINDADR